MNAQPETILNAEHSHVFLGASHDSNTRKTWSVIVLCAVMMFAEIAGGTVFGSLALVADGLHMSTHAGALLIAASAYTYARRHAEDRRFVFGTGKLSDLAGFTSAIVLAVIALLIGYEAVVRLLAPVDIQFAQAIPIAVVGLLVNIASAWLLSGEDHGHEDGHDHSHSNHEAPAHRLETHVGRLTLSIFEDGVPPVFRIHHETSSAALLSAALTVTTIRPDGARQAFTFSQEAGYLESIDEIPEPHEFEVVVAVAGGEHCLAFHEDHHAGEHRVDSRDHNMRAAYVHVIADAAVSVLAIIGLTLAKIFGWLWMDPLAGIVGALVIANWSYGLIRDTGAILLDVNIDERLTGKVRAMIEGEGDKLTDLHVWRLGPGHAGAVASVITAVPQRGPQFYHARLRRIEGLSHVTIEVHAPS